MTAENVPVLIVGGGPAGLCASICLSRLGVRHVLVEKHPSTTLHPKARSLSPRSLELMRPWGLNGRLAAAALPRSWADKQLFVETLAGKELHRVAMGGRSSSWTAQKARSPELAVVSAQDVFEPVWLEHAGSFAEADLRFGVSLDGIRQSSGGVSCTLRRIAAGQSPSGGGSSVDWSGHNAYRYEESTTELHAQYVLACDGWHSSVRKDLGIKVEGVDNLGTNINVYFHADLRKFINHRGSVIVWVTKKIGALLPLDGDDRWCCQIAYSERLGQKREDFTEEVCRSWIREVVGEPGLQVDIKSINAWAVHATVAEHFRHDRVLLVGDCAHQFPPTGGFGMNAGIADAFNVTWKVAAVLAGWAGDSLLDSYDEERRAASKVLRDWAAKNTANVGKALVAKGVSERAKDGLEQWSPDNLDLDALYQSRAVLSDVASAGEGLLRPGRRVPHMWFRKVAELGLGEQVSSVEVADSSFALLTQAATWADAAESAARDLRMPLISFHIVAAPAAKLKSGKQLLDEDGDFARVFGLGSGAVLVRPDGHVAWHCVCTEPPALASALANIQNVLRDLLQTSKRVAML